MKQRPRVLILSEIPTPYRLPLYRRLAALPSFEIDIAFCARHEPDRPWLLDEQLAGVPHRFLRGWSLTFGTKRNTFVYEVNPGIFKLLATGRYDAMVIGGYSVFAEQVAILWARARGVPYLLHSESHLAKQRRSWIAATKRFLLPALVRPAAAGLAVGSAAAEYLRHYGLTSDRIRLFPNTIDVDAYRDASSEARKRAAEIREAHQLPIRYVLYVGRLVESKGITDLLAALDHLGKHAPELVVAGAGPLEHLVRDRPGVRFLGFQQRDAVVELFALADRAVIPSRDEPWGVVVNEALACGCPVVVSDAVGAAVDLVRNGEDGYVVPVGDVEALAAALTAPVHSFDLSRGPISGWTYDFGVDQFVEALELALMRSAPKLD